MNDTLPSYDFDEILEDGEVLLIVPPFSHWAYGSLACHLLQACAGEQGIRTRVLYANLLLAGFMGEQAYKAITFDYHQMIGERLFCRAAYARKPFGSEAFEYRNGGRPDNPMSWTRLRNLEAQIDAWVERVATAVVSRGYRLVGATSSFQQTAPAIALLDRIKAHDPDVVTFIGGANCEGDMADGILSLRSSVDFVFSGESEVTFPDVAAGLLDGRRPTDRIVQGRPCTALDELPTPRYHEYYDQLERALPGISLRTRIWQIFETSRGCWWGRKSHCTFCGLNGNAMAFREKSPDRVLDELEQLIALAPTRHVMTTDNILPHNYFKSLVPRLGKALPGLTIHYECKANLGLDRLQALAESGIRKIQPGIEALSTPLLKRMAKGVTASKNVALLRYCRMLAMEVRWNLLCHFPGDRLEDYEQTLRLLPKLRHLHPPTGMFALSIDRFSPYFDDPRRYGLSGIDPDTMYEGLWPETADAARLAYHFQAEYNSGSREAPALIDEIGREIDRWQCAWNADAGKLPSLFVQALSGQRYLLIDTRDLPGNPEVELIDADQMRVALSPTGNENADLLRWALDRSLGVRLDETFVALVTCEPDFLRELRAAEVSRAAKVRFPVTDATAATAKTFDRPASRGPAPRNGSRG